MDVEPEQPRPPAQMGHCAQNVQFWGSARLGNHPREQADSPKLMKMMEALLNADTEKAKQTRDELLELMPGQIRNLSDAAMKCEDALSPCIASCRCVQM